MLKLEIEHRGHEMFVITLVEVEESKDLPDAPIGVVGSTRRTSDTKRVVEAWWTPIQELGDTIEKLTAETSNLEKL